MHVCMRTMLQMFILFFYMTEIFSPVFSGRPGGDGPSATSFGALWLHNHEADKGGGILSREHHDGQFRPRHLLGLGVAFF